MSMLHATVMQVPMDAIHAHVLPPAGGATGESIASTSMASLHMGTACGHELVCVAHNHTCPSTSGRIIVISVNDVIKAEPLGKWHH